MRVPTARIAAAKTTRMKNIEDGIDDFAELIRFVRVCDTPASAVRICAYASLPDSAWGSMVDTT